MNAVYGDKCVDVSTVRRRVQQFRSQGCSTPVVSGESNIKFFKGRNQKLVKQWQKHIEGGDDYVEKRLCTVVNKG